MYAVVINAVAELEAYLPAWEKLVAEALEPNVFYEPWMLMPAIAAYGIGKHLQFVLIFRPDPSGQKQKPPRLCGFFPLEIQTYYDGLGKRLPIKTLSIWRHQRCYDGTPVVSASFAEETLAAFFDWLHSGVHGCSLFQLGHINGDGPFARLLTDYFYWHANLSYVTDCYIRALFRPAANAEQYVEQSVSSRHRRTLRNQEKRLAQKGKLDYLMLEREDDLDEWIAQFLKLEASGWKGHEGTAFANSEADQIFFSTIIKEAFRRGQLMMLALHLNGQPIASKCNLLSGPGSFAFRIAFDEEYSGYSPGVLLELENIRQLHARPEIRWMDSCADPDNFMVNHLWLDRRTIPTIVVGTGRRPGDLVVAAIPMLRWLNRRLLHRTVGEK